MARRPAGPVWHVHDLRITVVPDARAPGRWLCKALNRATGKRAQTQHASEVEAHRAARELVDGRRAEAVGRRPEDYTVADLVGRYERTRATLNPTRARSTAKATRLRLRYIEQAWGAWRPAMIGRDDLVDWLATLLAPPHGRGHLAPTTVQHTLRIFSQVLGSAADLGLPNPLRGLKMAAARLRPQTPWTPRELQTLLAVAREHWRHKPQYVLGLWLWMQSGLREGEVFALRDGAIDPATGTVRVEESYSADRLGPLKTHRKRPPFVILPTLSEAPLWQPGATAESWRVIEWYEQLRVRSLLGRGFLCGETPDRPWAATTMRVGFQAIVERAGLPYREPEIFRHTMAATLLARGAPTTLVCDQGAWESIAVVERVYAKYLPSVFTAHPRPVVAVAATISNSRRKPLKN